MNTTDLFVEILVIGVGAFTWLAMLMLSAFGYSDVLPSQIFSIPALLPVIALVYVLGILTDRIADILFEKLFINSIRKKYYANTKQHFEDRRTILVYSERLSELLEYGRSKLRIVRGWALNFLLILVSLNIFIATQVLEQQFRMNLLVFGNATLILLTILCWYSWRSFVETEYRKVKEQAEFLRSNGIAKKPHGSKRD